MRHAIGSRREWSIGLESHIQSGVSGEGRGVRRDCRSLRNRVRGRLPRPSRGDSHHRPDPAWSSPPAARHVVPADRSRAGGAGVSIDATEGGDCGSPRAGRPDFRAARRSGRAVADAHRSDAHRSGAHRSAVAPEPRSAIVADAARRQASPAAARARAYAPARSDARVASPADRVAAGGDGAPGAHGHAADPRTLPARPGLWRRQPHAHRPAGPWRGPSVAVPRLNPGRVAPRPLGL